MENSPGSAGGSQHTRRTTRSASREAELAHQRARKTGPGCPRVGRSVSRTCPTVTRTRTDRECVCGGRNVERCRRQCCCPDHTCISESGWQVTPRTSVCAIGGGPQPGLRPGRGHRTRATRLRPSNRSGPGPTCRVGSAHGQLARIGQTTPLQPERFARHAQHLAKRTG